MDSNLNNRIVEHHKRCCLFSDFHYGFRSSHSTLDLLKVYLIDFTGLLIGPGSDIQQWHLIYLRVSIGSGILVFFRKYWSLTEFQVGYLSLFCLFSVIIGFDWIWMEILRKNIQLMLQFLKSSFMCLPNSCYTLMTFLMMLSVTLLSMLKILLSILSVIRHQLELTSELKSDLLDTID